MNCWHCKTELIWGGDHDIEEDFQPVMYAEYSMVSNFSCPKCDSFVEVYKRRDAYDWYTKYKNNKIEIHEIPVWKTDIQTLNNISKPIVDIPGCVRVHRNNLTSLIDSDKDEYGTYTECGNFSIPSFEPLQYNPNEFVYTQSETPKIKSKNLSSLQ